MSPDAVSARTAQLDEEAKAAASGPIPLPSRETVLKLAGLLVGSLLAGAGAFLIARLDPTSGYCLAAGGLSAVLVATCLIYARMLDEDYWTLAFIYFVPFGDVYYFIANIWEYFPWLCVKYVGGAVLIGAGAGLAVR